MSSLMNDIDLPNLIETWESYNVSEDESDNPYIEDFIYEIKFIDGMYQWTNKINYLPSILNCHSVLSGVISLSIELYVRE